MNALIKFVVHKIWLITVLLLVLLAVYVSLGRMLLPRLNQYQAPIQDYLSQRLGAEVAFNNLRGQWRGFQPQVALDDFSLNFPGGSQTFQFDALTLQLDVWHSLWQRQPVFSHLQFSGIEIALQQQADGRWALGEAKTEQEQRNPSSINDVLRLLFSQEQIQIDNLQLSLTGKQGVRRTLRLEKWQLHCIAKRCGIGAEAQLEDEQQAPMLFAFNSLQFPGDPDFQLTGYLKSPPIAIEPWLALLGDDAPLKLRVDRLSWGGEFWLHWADGQLRDVRGQFSIPQMALAPQGQQLPPVEDLGAQFFLRKEPTVDGWSLLLKEFQFRWQEEAFISSQQDWRLSKTNEGKMLSLAADVVDLRFFAQTLLAVEQISDKLRKTLDTLKPSGRLANLFLQYRVDAAAPDDELLPRFQLEANLVRVGVAPWKNAPGAQGVDGYLKVTPNAGLVQLNSKDFTLFFPKLYNEKWHYEQADGSVYWQNQGRSFWLQGRDLHLQGATGLIDGRFSLAAPKEGIEPRLDLLIGLRDAPAKAALTYVPDKKVSPALANWLDQAVIEGRVSQGAFVYSGSARKGAAADTRGFHLHLLTDAVTLAYQPDWPPVHEAAASVWVSDLGARVESRAGRLFEVDLNAMSAEFVPSTEGGDLLIQAQMQGPLADGLKLLQVSPLRQKLFSLIDEFQAEGDMQLSLALGIPLKGQAELTTKVQVDTDNGRFAIPSLNLSFDRLAGQFHYTNESGLSATEAKALLFGDPLTASISSLPYLTEGKKKHQTQINVNGQLSTTALQDWLKHPLFKQFQGKTAYQAQLDLAGAGRNTLVIKSQLKGVAVNLPQPLGKSAAQERALRYEIDLSGTGQHQLRYGKNFSYALRFFEGGFDQGQVRLGSAPALFSTAPGIEVVGGWPHLSIDPWRELLTSLTSAAPAVAKRATKVEPETAAQGLALIRRLDLNLDTLDVGARRFEQVKIQANKVDEGWVLHVENPVLKGKVGYYDDTRKPMDIALEYLRLPKTEKDGSDPLAEVNPSRLALANFSTEEFSVGALNYGRWAFNIRPNDKGARIESIKSNAPGVVINGEMDWRLLDGAHQSQFRGALASSDIGKALETWGYARSIEGKEAEAFGGLGWPGSPAMFSLKHASGDLNIAAKEGRLLEVEGSANVLRLFGIFNFSSLARRLRLDFSDVFMKGYSFDTLQGKLAFHAGQLNITESLIIEGPSAKFKIDGNTDLIGGQLDQDMIVVLPVGDNIPIAAAVVGAPQVGIPLYLLNKVFGDMFERFTSARYRVTGDWADPKIELVKIFENRPVHKEPVVEEASEPATTK